MTEFKCYIPLQCIDDTSNKKMERRRGRENEKQGKFAACYICNRGTKEYSSKLTNQVKAYV